MGQRARGFTLVELIVVIVILGILAATALPKFVNLQSDAKQASMKGLAGGLRAAVEVVRGKWNAAGSTSVPTVTMGDGSVVDVGTTAAAAGVPTGSATGIGRALGSMSGYTPTYGAVTSFAPAAGPASCVVTYDESNGVVSEAAINATNCP